VGRAGKKIGTVFTDKKWEGKQWRGRKEYGGVSSLLWWGVYSGRTFPKSKVITQVGGGNGGNFRRKVGTLVWVRSSVCPRESFRIHRLQVSIKGKA